MPFKVSKDQLEVIVLGTRFNVNAYDDEASIKVTLLEGSVKIVNGNASGQLKPGQQAQVKGSGLTVQSGIDMDEVMAWKNGLFQFEKADIHSIMRQVERWYDVEVVYENENYDYFGGRIPREENASKLLQMLEMTNRIHFEINGRKITVKP
jgi:ferric-dicitrate binding protein FerR (iron transport regulator)